MDNISLEIPYVLEEDLMNYSPHAGIVTDEKGIIVHANQLVLKASGFHIDHIKGCSFQTIVDTQDDITSFYDDMTKTIQKKENYPRVKWKDCHGEKQISDVLMIKVWREDKPFYYISFLNITNDLTLPLTERFVKQLTTDVDLGVILVNRNAQIVEISEMACEILGLERKASLNKKLDDVFQGLPEQHRVFKRSLLEGVVMKNRAISWMGNNQRYELLMDSNTLYDERGELVGAYVVFKDVTNLRSIEQKIQRSDRLAMIGQIAAGTAHEIRNPLTSIKGFLQMLHQSLEEKELDKEKKFTEIMLTEIKRINSLVSEFLLLSKPDDVQYQLVDLVDVFHDILPIVQQQAILHGIDVVNDISDDLPMVIGDEKLMKQVFLNICKNGIEAMGSDGELSISTQVDREKKHVCVDIRDTGPGIPAYMADKIFDPFFTTKEEGTGLGLSVCQKIIDDIGGQIRVSTKGYGTTFHVIIPCSM